MLQDIIVLYTETTILHLGGLAETQTLPIIYGHPCPCLPWTVQLYTCYACVILMMPPFLKKIVLD